MHRCIQLARKGLGSVSPNPLVGAVIVKNNKIIGEGYHRVFGGKHAEVNAMESVSEDSDLLGATMYVNLEPCTHHGKTPPCADKILASGIAKVIIAGRDPSSKVNGKGIEKLKNTGVEVITDVLQKEEERLNCRFRTFHRLKRPYIILKWAQSSDGFMDINRSKNEKGSFQISSQASKRLLHKWRSEEMAILIGTNTAQIDNPRLNVRLVEGKSPLRLVLDLNDRLDKGLNIFNDGIDTVVYSGKKIKQRDSISFKQISNKNNVLPEVMKDLYEREIQSVIVEGGRQLLDSFLTAGLWDEIRQIVCPVELKEGLPAPIISVKPFYEEQIDNDTLLIHKRE